jgi:hypothetical protein
MFFFIDIKRMLIILHQRWMLSDCMSNTETPISIKNTML